MTNSFKNLAIIGSGATGVYLLKHLLNNHQTIKRLVNNISVFEKSKVFGCGMPYDTQTTDIHSMSNIASEEIPVLQTSFADWLRAQDHSTLRKLNLHDKTISDSEVYNRVALGQYFCSQYNEIIECLRQVGFSVNEYPATEIIDLIDKEDKVILKDANGATHQAEYLFISTGHNFPNEDKPEYGYYSSPWPISKLLPPTGEYFNYTLGTLGASLSAFDVISSLFRRHGKFERQGEDFVYTPHRGAEDFKITMHDANGWLPHLQYEQKQPMRSVYRHVSRDNLLAMIDSGGYLRLAVYFDNVCRPALSKAFRDDFKPEMIIKLKDPSFRLTDFVEEMSVRHSYDDPFAGMRQELPVATDSVNNDRPIHWKEVTDDLFYTLNYHAELMPAEDHITFNKIVMPFLMNVIAAMPLASAKVMLALHAAGKLALQAGNIDNIDFENQKTLVQLTDQDGKNQTCDYKVFVSCGGQHALEIQDYPFNSLVQNSGVQAARVNFAAPETDADPHYLLKGIDIDDGYRVIGKNNIANHRIRDVSFTHTLGLRPYSYGLQACNLTAKLAVDSLVS